MPSVISTVEKSAEIRAQLSKLSGVALGEPGMAVKSDLFGQYKFEEWLLTVLTGIYERLDAVETAKATSRQK